MQQYLKPELQKIKGFAIENLLGKGSYGNVYSCRSYTGRKLYAAKVVDYGGDNSLKWGAENEIEILKDLGRHINIVRFHCIVRNIDQITTILEYIPGTDLLQGIIDWPFFNEHDAKIVVNQILSALQYCHSKRIVHRDVRPHNIIWVESPTRQNSCICPSLKLIDFNLARKIAENINFINAKPQGDPTHMAPECLREPSMVTFSSDIWSVGVLLFTILAGYPPFRDYNYNYLILNIIEGNYALPESLWKHVTPSGQDIVKSMFHMDCKERWTAKELLSHTWFSSYRSNNYNYIVWPGQRRISTFLKKLEEQKRRSDHREFNLKEQERTAFIPDEEMIS